jgi:hypothetical protein
MRDGLVELSFEPLDRNGALLGECTKVFGVLFIAGVDSGMFFAQFHLESGASTQHGTSQKRLDPMTSGIELLYWWLTSGPASVILPFAKAV